MEQNSVVQLPLIDLRAFLQKHGNLRATSNKMVCKTTVSQNLKPKRKINECIMEITAQY